VIDSIAEEVPPTIQISVDMHQSFDIQNEVDDSQQVLEMISSGKINIYSRNSRQ